MILSFTTTTADHGPTNFPAKILLHPVVQQERDTAYYLKEVEKARKQRWHPKIHSAREDKTDRWDEGKIIQFATHVRSPELRMFGIAMCTGYQRMKLWTDNVQVFVQVDNRLLTGAEVVRFYQNDGFDTIDQFISWFMPLCVAAQAFGPMFALNRKLIHWTDFRY